MFCGWVRRCMVCLDDLSDEERRQLQEHVRQCPNCARHWQQWERLRLWLAQLPPAVPPPDAKQKLLATLRQLPHKAVDEWDCALTRRHLWRWLDGDLTPSERTSLLAHLAACDSCQAALWASERLLTLLRHLPKVPAPPESKEAIKAHLRQLQRRPTVWWRFAVPTAAAAAIVFALIVHPWRPAPSPDGHRPGTSTHQARTPHPPKREPLSLPSKAHLQPSLSQAQAKTVSSVPSSLPKQPRPIPLVASTHQPAHPKATPRKRWTKPPQPTHVAVRPALSRPLVPQVVTLTESRPASVLPESLMAKDPVALPSPQTAIPSAERLQPALPAPSDLKALPQPATPPSVASSSPASESKSLVVLPPVTIEAVDKPLARPPLRLSTVPPSQRLYQRAGVAFLKVEPEKRPIIPPEPALSAEPSIPMAAERYRSRTAVVPLTRLGISW